MDDMRALIADLPHQLRWAAATPPPEMPFEKDALVAGMGGSGFAGDVASVYAAAKGYRVSVHKSYGLPGWAQSVRPLVIGVSHSGNTEETLSAVRATIPDGLSVAATATGGQMKELCEEHGIPFFAIPDGPQPRAAAGYLSGAVLRMLERSGVIGTTTADLEEAARVVEELLKGEAQSEADRIAESLQGRATIVYGGSGVGTAAAGRWKTQINENGKAPAWWSAFPELDHNEIVGWTAFPDVSRDAVAVVMLHDRDDHPRIAQRARLTAELMEGVPVVGDVVSRGDGVLARLFSLVVIGDLVSVSLAEKAGVDPVPVDVIEDLKRRLADEQPAAG